MGKVYLTGAGPGDLELLTVKALKLIQSADVIIYDRLANQNILKEAKKDCKLIYVGKESSKHTIPQKEINELIYKSALLYDSVVRLKGGDPVVFGRGGEEGIFLSKKGIDFEFVPGISSAIAVAESAYIPVTHRKVSSSFKVVAGHGSKNIDYNDKLWQKYIDNETVIFLMGLHRLKIIASKLIEAGNPENFPVAVISRGTTKDEKVVTGTLKNIAKKAKDLQTPAIIIVGEVVNLREELKRGV